MSQKKLWCLYRDIIEVVFLTKLKLAAVGTRPSGLRHVSLNTGGHNNPTILSLVYSRKETTMEA